MAIEALRAAMAGMGLDIKNIDAWFSSWDYAALAATLIRSLLEELPVNIGMIKGDPTGLFNLRDFDRGSRTPRHIAQQLGLSEWVPLIGTPHHDNHAWFSFATSPFAHDPAPVMVAVLDGLGDMGSISLYVCEGGRMRQLYSNDSVFDSLGIFYSVISSTQGGWTWLSSEGRYMGATAYGNGDRKTNPYYAALKPILSAAAGRPHRHQPRSRQLAARHSAQTLYPRTHPHSWAADRTGGHVEPGRGAAHRRHPAQGKYARAARQGGGERFGRGRMSCPAAAWSGMARSSADAERCCRRAHSRLSTQATGRSMTTSPCACPRRPTRLPLRWPASR